MTSSGAYNAADALRSYKISVTSRTTSDPQKPGLLSLATPSKLHPRAGYRVASRIASRSKTRHDMTTDCLWKRIL